MSLRAAAVRKLLVRAKLDASTPLAEQRARMERTRLPRATKVATVQTQLGGVPAIETVPDGANARLAVLHLHGGGYVMGSARTHAGFAGRLARASRARTWVIDYRLAPEHPFPAALDDALAAFRALLERHEPGALAITGDSAGGGLALATLVALREAGDPLPAAAVLVSPWVDLTLSRASVQRLAAIDPLLDEAWLRRAAAQYAGEHDLASPLLSPVNADLAGLPPLLVLVGDHEIFFDEDRELVERAQAAGTSAELSVGEGLWHVWPMFAPLVPEATRSIDEIAGFLSRQLDGSA